MKTVLTNRLTSSPWFATALTLTLVCIFFAETTWAQCPTAITGSNGPFCAGDPSVALNADPNSGGTLTGTFSGPGVTDGAGSTGTFNPTTAGAGQHTIIFTPTSAAPDFCTQTITTQVQVYPIHSAAFNVPQVLCENSSAWNAATDPSDITPISLSTPPTIPAFLSAQGYNTSNIITWYGDLVTDTGASGSFNAGNAPLAGTYTICVDVGYGGACVQTQCQTILVTPQPNPTIVGRTVCINEYPTTVDLTVMFSNTAINPTTPGGAWTLSGGTGVGTVNGDVLTVTQAGTFTFTYTVTTEDNVSNTCDAQDTGTLTVQYRNPRFDAPSSFCLQDGSINMANYLLPASTTGGTWTMSTNGGGAFNNAVISAAGVFDPLTAYNSLVANGVNPRLAIVRYTVTGTSCTFTHEEIVLITTDCNCPEISTLSLNYTNLCSGTAFTATAFTDEALLDQTLAFSYSISPTANTNPYASGTALGTAIVSGTTPAASANFNLPANTTCDPIQYTVFAYLTNTTITNLTLSAECRPVAATTITVWPNPSAVASPVVTTQDCVSTITVNCSGAANGFTVSPATYVAAENYLGGNINVTISAGVGSPCADFATTAPIPACNIDCPDIYDVVASNQNICSVAPYANSQTFAITVATEEELVGSRIYFAYGSSATADPYTAGLTIFTAAPTGSLVATVPGGINRATLANASLPANNTCNPVTWFVYAYVNLGSVPAPGLPANCRPVAVVPVTVWPNPEAPAFAPGLITTTNGCTSYFTYPTCPNWLVNPDGFTANIGDVNNSGTQDNISVTVTVSVGGGIVPACESTTTLTVPECWQGELTGAVNPISGATFGGGIRNEPVDNPVTNTFSHATCPPDGAATVLAFCDYLDHNFQPAYQGDALLYNGVTGDYLDCGQVEARGIGGNPFDAPNAGYDYRVERQTGGTFALFVPTNATATQVFVDATPGTWPVNGTRAGALNFFGLPDGYYRVIITDEDGSSYNVYFYIHCNRPEFTTQPTMTHAIQIFSPAGSNTYAPVPVPDAVVVVEAQRICLAGDNTIGLNAAIAAVDATTYNAGTGVLVNTDNLCFAGGSYTGNVSLIPAFLQSTVQYSWSVSPNLDVAISNPAIANPTLTFTNNVTRIYEITIVATDRFGCAITETHTLTVDPPVDADLQDQTICFDTDLQYDLTDMFANPALGIVAPGLPGQEIQGATTPGGTFELVSAVDHLGADVSALTSISAGGTLFYPVAGIYTIRYYISNDGNSSGLDNNCEDESTAVLYIIPQPSITFDVIDGLCLSADDYPRDLRQYYALATPPGAVSILPGDPQFTIATASLGNATIDPDGQNFQPTLGYYGPVEVCVTSSYTLNGVLCTDTKCDIIQILEPITHTRVCNCTGGSDFTLDITLNGGLPAQFGGGSGPESFYNIDFLLGVTSPATPPTTIQNGGTFTVTVVGGQPYIIRVWDGVGCEYFVTGTCGNNAQVDYLGLNGNYCFNDPPTTLYDQRFYDLVAGNEPPQLCNGFNLLELYTWEINTNNSGFVNGTDANGLDDDLTNPGQAVFIPQNAGPGMHVIRYCIDFSQCPDYSAALGQCIVCEEKIVYVYPEFDPSFETNVPAVICGTPATPINLVLDDIANVTNTFNTYAPFFDPNNTNPIPDVEEYVQWSVNGNPLATNPDGSADFVPTNAGVNIIRVEVGYEDCVYEAIRAVNVVEAVNATLSGDITICSNPSQQFNLTQLFIPNITTPGGTWSVVGAAPTGTQVSGDVLSYDVTVIDPSSLITIRYAVGNIANGTPDPADGDCYGEFDVNITLDRTPDTRNFDLPDVVCSGGLNLILADYLQPIAGATGTFSSTAILTGGDTELDLTATGPGIYTVTYTETVGTCTNSITETIQVVEGGGTVNLTATQTNVCIDQIPFDLTALEGGSTPGGTWSGPGVFGNLLFATGTGTYTVTYCVNAPICQVCQSTIIQVVPTITSAGVLRSDDICITPADLAGNPSDFQQFNLNVLLDNTTPGGTWSLGAVPLGANGVINGNVLSYQILDGGALGNYAFVIQYTVGTNGAGGGCEEVSLVGDITIRMSNPLWDAPSSFCTVDGSINLNDYFLPTGPLGTIGTTTTGLWSIQNANGTPYTGTAFTGIGSPTGTWNVLDETPGLYALTWYINTPASCFGVSHTEIIEIEQCPCPQFNILTADATAICENGGSSTVTLFANPVFAGAQIRFGATLSSLGANNPYDVAPPISLGSSGAFVVASSAQASLTIDNGDLGATPICNPAEYTIYAYLDNPAAVIGMDSTCAPFVVTTVTVWPDPANAILTTTTNECTTTFTSSCPNYIVSPSTYVASPGDSDTFTTVTVSGGSGSPCANFVANNTVFIPACDQLCPDIDDLQASVNSICGNAANADFIAIVEQELVGVDITFGYTLAPTIISNPNDLPVGLTIIGINPAALLSGNYVAQVSGIALPAPNPTLGQCEPITYVVYAFVTNGDANGAGLTANCRPVAMTTVTVYPDPSLIAVTPILNTNGLSCTYTMTPSCPGFLVYPAIYTANPGNPATNVAVSVAGSSGGPCGTTVNTVSVNVPACDACVIGFNPPGIVCGTGTLNLANYTAFLGGTWTIENIGTTGGSIDGGSSGITGILDLSTVNYIGGVALMQVSYTLPASSTCSVTTETHFITIYESVSVNLDPTPGTEFCMGSGQLPFNVNNYWNALTTTGGTWTVAGPDPASLTVVDPLTTNFDPSLPGTYVLTYSVENGPCAATGSITVTVYPALNTTITAITVCESPSGTINLPAMLTPTTTLGGLFGVVSTSSAGLTATLSPSTTQLTYAINPSATLPYTITVSYTVTSLSGTVGCATSTSTAIITITGATETGFDLPDAWCAEGTFNLAN
ncbi:MAG TPA: hypothetical protein PK239_07855, partial [Chitinophagales bacterium]|nr:hypothetical protein [Chitinophagales bacterium]